MRPWGILGNRGDTGQLYLCYLSTSSSGLPNFCFGMEKLHPTQNILMGLLHSAIPQQKPSVTIYHRCTVLTNKLKLPWFHWCEQTQWHNQCLACTAQSSISVFSIKYLPYWGSITSHFKETIIHQGCFPHWFQHTQALNFWEFSNVNVSL